MIPINGNLERRACDDISGSCNSDLKLQSEIYGAFLDGPASRIQLYFLWRICSAISLTDDASATRRTLIDMLQTRCNNMVSNISFQTIEQLFHRFDLMRKPMLLSVAVGHGLSVQGTNIIKSLRDAVIHHITSGRCASYTQVTIPPQCGSILNEFDVQTSESNSTDMLQIRLLSSVVNKLMSVPLRHILDIHAVEYDKHDSTAHLWRHFRKYIRELQKSKFSTKSLQCAAKNAEQQKHLQEIRHNWPQIVPENVKQWIHHLFREETSSEHLREFTCASCAESKSINDRENVDFSDIDLELLCWPDKICWTPGCTQFNVCTSHSWNLDSPSSCQWWHHWDLHVKVCILQEPFQSLHNGGQVSSDEELAFECRWWP